MVLLYYLGSLVVVLPAGSDVSGSAAYMKGVFRVICLLWFGLIGLLGCFVVCLLGF